jgi:hypothetical protein
MKNLILIVALTAAGFASEARAQWQPGLGGAGDIVGGILFAGAAIDGLAGAGGLVAGTGTAIQVGRHGNARPWWIASLALGGVNAALSLGWTALAANNFWDKGFVGVAAAHMGVAAFDFVMAAVGITHPPPVEPTLVSGRDVSGRKWTGMGLQLARF